MQFLRIGLLYSRSGPMAKQEQPMLDAALMAIAEINQSGGVLGWPLEAVIADGCSETWIYVREARRLLKDEGGVTMLFGGGPSDTRKAIIPLLESYNALLWYPRQYEGVELSRNVFYTGACPNQFVEPAIAWLLSQGKRRFFLLGSEAVFPRLINKVAQAQLSHQGGVALGETYVAQEELNFSAAIAQIHRLQPDIVFNALNPELQPRFYRQYHRASRDGEQIPTLSLSLTEVDLQELGEAGVGHYAVRSYFQGAETWEGKRFTTQYQDCYGRDRPVSDPIATAYSQMFLWRHAMESAESFHIDDIRVAAYGEKLASPLGQIALEINHHCSRPCYIGRSNNQRRFDIVHGHPEPIEPLPWLGVETAGLGNSTVVIDMLGQVSRSMQQAWELSQKSAELETAAQQLQAEVMERYRAEEASRLLFDISQTMAEAVSFECAMALAIQQVCRLTGWPYGEVWMPSEDGEQFEHTPFWHLEEDQVSPEQLWRLRNFREMSQRFGVKHGEELVGRVWASGQAEWVNGYFDFGAVAVPILASRRSLASCLGDGALELGALELGGLELGGLELRPSGTGMEAQGAGEAETWVSDPETTAAIAAIASPPGQGRVLAILLFLQPEARAEDKRFVQLVSTIAAQLGSTVQQKQAEQALQLKNAQLAQTLQQLQTAQDELVHSEKMVALGQLVAGIAHEINTPLGAICSSAEYISDYLHRDLPGLSKFFQDLSGSQRQLLEKVLTQQSDRCCLLSSRERRSRRRSLQQALETAAIPGARSLSEQLMAIQAQWNLEELLPLLREANGLAFLQGLGRLLELKHSSQDINIAAERASKVVFALKTYARYDHMGEPLQVNLEASLETILTLYQNKLKQGIEVHRSYEAIPEILGYPDELNQVWMNLIHNAIQAMGDAGNLGIVLRQGPGCARVSIADSGCGIPEAVQARMFEPFFTTKPPGEGSGLGLDIVKKIVEKHGGHIQVSSRPSYTIFTVVLPLAPQAAEAQEADEVQGEGQGEGQAGDGDTMDRLFSTMVLG